MLLLYTKKVFLSCLIHFSYLNSHSNTHTFLAAVCTGESTDFLSTGQVVGITVVVTFIVTLLIGLAVGVGMTFLIVRDKTHKTVDVPTEAPPQQQQPTPGPLYEEVAPAKEEIELKTNEAYGPVGQ